MSLFVNASQEEAFRSLMDYFTGRRMRILTSNPPSYIRVQFGSWFSLGLGKAQGEVEVNVVKRNGGSYANLNFAFFKEYLHSMIVGVIGTLIILVFDWWFMNTFAPQYASSLPPALRDEYLSMVSSTYTILVLIALLCFCVIMVLSGYNASLTRRRFIEEFNMFMQSLASKTD